MNLDRFSFQKSDLQYMYFFSLVVTNSLFDCKHLFQQTPFILFIIMIWKNGPNWCKCVMWKPKSTIKTLCQQSKEFGDTHQIIEPSWNPWYSSSELGFKKNGWISGWMHSSLKYPCPILGHNYCWKYSTRREKLSN